MTRTALGLILGVLLLVGGWFGYEKYREHQRTKHDAALGKVEVFSGEVAVTKDSVRIHEPGVARADSNLTHVLTRPALPKPTIHTGGQIKTDTAVKDTTQYVTLASYNRLEQRRDSTAKEAEAYRDTTRLQLLRYPRLVAFQDSVTKYQRVALNTPKPSRRWGLGIGPGYGFALVKGRVVQAPTGTVTLSYRIF